MVKIGPVTDKEKLRVDRNSDSTLGPFNRKIIIKN
jgi:hypothetical protein